MMLQMLCHSFCAEVSINYSNTEVSRNLVNRKSTQIFTLTNHFSSAEFEGLIRWQGTVNIHSRRLSGCGWALIRDMCNVLAEAANIQ